MIIGVMGQARAGKDTLADYLVRKYGFVRIAFADPIKRALRDWYGFSESQLWGDDKEKPDFRYPIPGKGHLTARVAAQVLGTEAGRLIWADTWSRLGLEHAGLVLAGKYDYDRSRGLVERGWWSRFKKKPTGVVFSDVRFLNEVHGIRAAPNGFVVRVKRKTAKGSVGLSGHQSEEEQKTIPDHSLDHVIENNGTLQEFYLEVDKMLRKAPKGERLKLVA